MRRRTARIASACAVVAATALAPREAAAWYFPEHVVLTHEGLTQLAPEVREVIREAIIRAKRDGLALCEAIDVPLEQLPRDKPLTTRMIHVAKGTDCVPYSALPALAGDHASSARELFVVLSSQKGIEITSAAAYEWQRFQQALDQLPNTSLERMSFVHALDVAFYFVDPGYELRAQGTRAHFADASRSFDTVVRAAGTGRLDNALEQFLAHHVRSLELAARGQAGDALLEHGFALHFLQDSFAAGHLIQAGWSISNERQRRRHDFYNARGLAVGRASSAEPCTTLGAGSLELSLPACWVTSGDGYLGLWADSSDRLHASRAMAKAQLQFALALDPMRVTSFVEGLGERQQIAIGQLIEPSPWWTVPASSRHQLKASAARTLRLIRGASAAVDRLRALKPTPALEVGALAPVPFFDPQVLAFAVDPCDAAPKAGETESEDVAACGPTKALALGTVGASLLRPLLVEWPTPQADPETLQGESKEDLGWAVQLVASLNARVLVPSGQNVDFFVPSIGVAGGLSYRWGTYLPGRLNRSVVELNVGISDALHFDTSLRAGGNPHVTMLDQELRWPIAYELLTSYKLPFDVARGHGAGHVLLLSGVRTHQMLKGGAPVFWGLELEAIAIALSRGRGAYPLYAASPEIRFYVGAADPSVAQPSLPSEWAPTIGIALTGGYATFL